MDKGAFFGTVFLGGFGMLLKMDVLFGYPLDGPHKFVLFLLLLLVCVYGHYSMKAIRIWAFTKNPRNYGVETCSEVKAIRNTVREIYSRCNSASLEDWQRWDDDFFDTHLSKTERDNEWVYLRPIAVSYTHLTLPTKA